MSTGTDAYIFTKKPRYLNFQYEELESENNLININPAIYSLAKKELKTTSQIGYGNESNTNLINPAISSLARQELKTTSQIGYGNRIAGFSQFSMKPLETRNNYDYSVNKTFASGMDRKTRTTPIYFVQPIPSRYQILDPKPDEFEQTWSQPGGGNNDFELV